MKKDNLPDDEFLRAYYQQPKPAFRQQLREQLLATHKLRRKTMFSARQPQSTATGRFAFVLVACLLIGTALFLPINHTTFAQVINQWVAILPFRQIDSLPQTTSDTLVIKQTSQEHRQTIKEAQELIPFALPTWVPEQFTMTEVTVSNFGTDTDWTEDDFSDVTIVWQQDETQFSLTALERKIPILVGDDQDVTEVLLADTPAAIHRGMWDEATNSYVMLAFITVSWERDGIYYHLSGFETAVSEATLIRIASSSIEAPTP